MSARNNPRSLEIDCPNGHAVAGMYCNGLGLGADLCQARINAMTRRTREANKRARAAAGSAPGRSVDLPRTRGHGAKR